jgi:hypothetical protein
MGLWAGDGPPSREEALTVEALRVAVLLLVLLFKVVFAVAVGVVKVVGFALSAAPVMVRL